MNIYKLIFVSISLFLLGSCAKNGGMHITTNTFANKKVIPQGFETNNSFAITTNQKGDPLFTQEVSQKIATILKNKGFVVSTTADADYNLNFSFAMNKSTHVRDVPVYIPDYGHWYYHRFHHHYAYGYSIAYVPEEYTLFHKILLVEVYKNSRNQLESSIPVWQGTAHSYEEDSNLRDAIDYLLVTVFKYFGKNTQKYVRSKMSEDDAEVAKLRREYFQPIGYVEKK